MTGQSVHICKGVCVYLGMMNMLNDDNPTKTKTRHGSKYTTVQIFVQLVGKIIGKLVGVWFSIVTLKLLLI